MSAASITVKIGIASVAIPAVAAIVGALLMAIIPGCKCDEGAGCGGCGPLNGLIAFFMLGGFTGALAALLSILPGSLLLAGAFALFSSETSLDDD